MKYEPQVSGSPQSFEHFYGLKVHIPGNIVVYLILISTLPILKGRGAWKFVREKLMDKSSRQN